MKGKYKSYEGLTYLELRADIKVTNYLSLPKEIKSFKFLSKSSLFSATN